MNRLAVFAYRSSLVLGITLVPAMASSDEIALLPGKPWAAGTLDFVIEGGSSGAHVGTFSVAIAGIESPAKKAFMIDSAFKAAFGNTNDPGAFKSQLVGSTVHMWENGPTQRAGVSIRHQTVPTPTGETDSYQTITIDPKGASGWTQLLSTASGVPFPGSGPPRFRIGTSLFTAEIPTLPGQTPEDLMAQAYALLAANGVSVEFFFNQLSASVDIPTGQSFVIGTNDTGLHYAMRYAPEPDAVPASSPIAMALLFMSAVLTGAWALKKRRTPHA